jgi:hypothetical protein
MNSPQSIDRIASPEANWGQIEGYQDIKKRGASQAVAKLDFATHHPLPMTGPGEAYSTRNGKTALARNPTLAEATVVGTLSAQLRRPGRDPR